jgi:hypothetical protein
MPVECVEEFGLQDQGMRFEKAHAFDDGKVLVDVSLTSHTPNYAGHVSEREASRIN